MHPPATRLRCDLLVIGGGINGTGIARDAAGRGLSVVLCERDDLASHTSSASTKLIHGGLRYLEHYAFSLVRKALLEREVLMRGAPHLIRPLRFIVAPVAGGRPAWMVRCGLFLYDWLAPRTLLAASSAIDLRRHAAGAALRLVDGHAFAYSDAWVDDARLVVLNAVDARERGATIFTRTACTSLAAVDGRWHARLEGAVNLQLDANAVVNAAGPWAGSVAALAAPAASASTAARAVRLVKGSHIVLPCLFGHDDAYLFQHDDGRVVFAIPYQDDYTLIGTTDLVFTGDPATVAIDAGETAYLLDVANRCFKRHSGPADIVWSYSGVRPLLDDGSDGVDNPSALTRDYAIAWAPDAPPLLNVWGGKITTYRKLAEQAVTMLGQRIGVPGAAWTGRAFLPGGDIEATTAAVAIDSMERFSARLASGFPWLPSDLLRRYARSYGSRSTHLLGQARALADLGEEIAPGLHQAEVDYLVEHEWARSAADILWRRTKLGLRCAPGHVARLERYLDERRARGGLTPSPATAQTAPARTG